VRTETKTGLFNGIIWAVTTIKWAKSVKPIAHRSSSFT